ncbi:MAG: hypothetical protein NZM43_01710 [Saprospiraceae bacterium]|nr:hypothetical protein [Saprospiraceae bacterium]MDW8483017.1 hypothetical protein [Saprospiraceae bacterium]
MKSLLQTAEMLGNYKDKTLWFQILICIQDLFSTDLTYFSANWHKNKVISTYRALCPNA